MEDSSAPHRVEACDTSSLCMTRVRQLTSLQFVTLRFSRREVRHVLFPLTLVKRSMPTRFVSSSLSLLTMRGSSGGSSALHREDGCDTSLLLASESNVFKLAYRCPSVLLLLLRLPTTGGSFRSNHQLCSMWTLMTLFSPRPALVTAPQSS